MSDARVRETRGRSCNFHTWEEKGALPCNCEQFITALERYRDKRHRFCCENHLSQKKFHKGALYHWKVCKIPKKGQMLWQPRLAAAPKKGEPVFHGCRPVVQHIGISPDVKSSLKWALLWRRLASECVRMSIYQGLCTWPPEPGRACERSGRRTL